MKDENKLIAILDLLEEDYNKKKDMKESDKDDLLSNMNRALTLAKKELIENEEKIAEYEKKLKTPELYDKSDIKRIFKCGDSKSLYILRDAVSKGYGLRMGKEYFFEAQYLEEYIQSLKKEALT